jgi:hypothetical protein
MMEAMMGSMLSVVLNQSKSRESVRTAGAEPPGGLRGRRSAGGGSSLGAWEGSLMAMGAEVEGLAGADFGMRNESIMVDSSR